jgi:hypothetical protein
MLSQNFVTSRIIQLVHNWQRAFKTLITVEDMLNSRMIAYRLGYCRVDW